MAFKCGSLMAGLLLSAATSAQALQYTVTNVGSLVTNGALAYGINASGQVAGQSGTNAFGTASTTGIINPAYKTSAAVVLTLTSFMVYNSCHGLNTHADSHVSDQAGCRLPKTPLFTMQFLPCI